MLRRLLALFIAMAACAPKPQAEAPTFADVGPPLPPAVKRAGLTPQPGGLEVAYSEAVAALAGVCNQRCLVPLRPVKNPSVATIAGTPAGPHAIYHDPVALRAIGRVYGQSAVVGVFAHELGHAQHIRDGVRMSQWDAELYADMWAGCALRRLGYATGELEAFLLTTQGGKTHPGGVERAAAVNHGWGACG